MNRDTIKLILILLLMASFVGACVGCAIELTT